MMKKLLLIFILFLNILYAKGINIVVSPEASFVIQMLKKDFLLYAPDVTITLKIQNNKKLLATIEKKSHYDIFLSNDVFTPNAMYNKGLTLYKPKIYARGLLVMFSKKNRSFCSEIYLFNSKKIKQISIIRPLKSLYGQATSEAFLNIGIYDEIKDKFVYNNSSAKTLKNILEVTNIGIIPKSFVFMPFMETYLEKLNYKEIKRRLYVAPKQGMVLFKRAKNNQEDKDFYRFILSKKGKRILKKYGYTL